MTKIKTLSSDERFAQMLEESKKQGLPKFYKDDLLIDKEILKGHESSSFLWVLRECGTAMIPLRKGVDPIHVTYWLGDESAIFYLVLKTGIKQIAKEKVKETASEPPCNLDGFDSIAGLVLAVRGVLKYGHDNGWWESEGKSWADMRSYFMNANNSVMNSFMYKAVILKAKFDSQRKAA